MAQRYNNPRPRTDIPEQVENLPVFNPKWIKERIDEGAVQYADKLGKILLDKKFTTSQIRNFYGELKRIQLKKIGNQIPAFLLLHPKLAYAAKRVEKTGSGATIFKNEIIKAHSEVKPNEAGFADRFQNFCDLCEAILAFHKAHGGKDN